MKLPKTSPRRCLSVAAALLISASASATPAYDFSSVEAQIDALVQRESLDGASLIVLRNGAPIYEHYFGSYTKTTLLPIASASKWLSALTIQRLVDQDRMHWSDTIGQYIPNAPADKSGITLAQLFSHTSGMTTNDAPCLGDRGTSLDACAQQILALPLMYAPGTAFAYTGNAMQVGGRMAEIATGESWQQLFAEQLTGPLAMSNSSFATASADPLSFGSANPQIAGGVVSTLYDYANVVQMVAQRGVWNGAQYLSGAGLTEMQRDQTHGVPVIFTPDPTALGYGYGEWRNLVDANSNAVQVSSTGKFGTSPWVDNETGVAAVFLVDSQYSLIANDLSQLWGNVRNVVQVRDAQTNVVNLDQFGLSGAWADSATSAQGLIVTTYPDSLATGSGGFAAGWYTYDVTAAGGQRWYTLQGAVTRGVFPATLGIYATTGGSFDAIQDTQINQVGTASLSFSDCLHGSMQYSFSDGSGRIGTLSLSRIDANVLCSTPGDNGSSVPGFLLSGAWADPNTSGQGLIFDINPNSSLAAAGWYTYAQNGSTLAGASGQRWYTIQGSGLPAGATTQGGLGIYEATGGTFDALGNTTTTQVGTASVAFSSCTAATFNYQFAIGENAGRSGTIEMIRIGPAPAGCVLP